MTKYRIVPHSYLSGWAIEQRVFWFLWDTIPPDIGNRYTRVFATKEEAKSALDKLIAKDKHMSQKPEYYP